MAGEANVRSIKVLDDLHQAFVQFREEAVAILDASVREIQRGFNWLEERLGYWHNQVRIRSTEVAAARAALASCRVAQFAAAAAGQDSARMCRGQEEELLTAEVRLAEARDQVQIVQYWIKRAQDEANAYRTEAVRLKGQLEQQLPKALNLLERAAATLRSYASISTATTSTSVGSWSGPAVDTSTGSIVFNAPAPHNLLTSENAPSVSDTVRPFVPPDDAPPDPPHVPAGEKDALRDVIQDRQPEIRDGGSGGIERGG